MTTATNTDPAAPGRLMGGDGLDAGTLTLMLEALSDFVTEALPPQRQLDLDHEDVCPEDTVRAMSGDALGVQLVFIPEEYGGMGGGAFDSYRVCERMARFDLGLATAVFATFLGSDPILVGATTEQKQHWLGRIAADGIVFAYGATEPEAGSDLGALTTTAAPVVEDDVVTGYRITGRKQWISNGSIADACTILALAPGGPSWFVVERGTPGFSSAPPEDKHGIRLSNTAALFLDDVLVPADHLVGGVEGRGLVEAQHVFGYTRLMVAAFGLGCGWEALDRAISYSQQREQGGSVRSRSSRATPTSSSCRTPSGSRPRAPSWRRPPTGSTPARASTARSTPRARSPSTWRPRRATPRPTPRSRRTAATASPGPTSWRRSSATCGSRRSTKAPPRSWR